MRVWRKRINGVLCCKLLGAALISNAIIVAGQSTYAEESLSITISSDTVTMDLTPENFASGGQTISVSTTNPTGYKINFQTTGPSTALIEKDDNSLTISTFTLPNGSSSLPADSTGYGYGYSVDGGANYLPVPDPSGGGVELFESKRPGTHEHDLDFGAMVSNDAVAGEYSNTFLITAIANDPFVCDSGQICYRGNGDDGTGEMPLQTVESNTTVTLWATNFSRPGYGFAGWNTESDGSGSNYGPSQDIVIGDVSESGLMLYANWIPSAGDLQNWHGCGSMRVGDVTALTDSRDGNTYAIAKYVDGHCWMMENLRLDFSNPNLEISALNTNNPTSDFINAVVSHPASTNDFCTTNGSACLDRFLYNTNNTNRNLTPNYATNDDSSSWYSYGNYYNWYTATAGHGTASFATNGTSVDGDICPAGWRLPTGYGSSGDLSVLDRALGGSGGNQTAGDAGLAASRRWRNYPLNYIYSGEQNGQNSYNRNNSGGYNTANVSTSERSVNLWIKPNAISVSSNNTLKNRGQTTRCVINEKYSAIGNIHYDSNGGTGSMADEENIVFSTAVAANNSFTKDNAVFLGWNSKADGTGIMIAPGGSVAKAANDMGITEGDTLTLYAIWKSVYHVVYDGNNADAGVMSVTHEYSETNVGLIASNFSRDGYGFAGWSLDAEAGDKLLNHEPVTVYGPNQTIRLDRSFLDLADANNNISLYAVWLPADDTYTMQTFGSAQCAAMQTGDFIALTDERDNDTYAVAKLIDGNCWMSENLRLEPSSVAFSETNTNSPTAAFISEAPLSSDSTTLCNKDTSACINQILFNANNTNRTLSASYISNNDSSSWYSYGTMYGWYTATAGNGTYEMSEGTVAGDICPAGWRLPTGGKTGEFKAFSDMISTDVVAANAGLISFPNNFIYSGDYNYNKGGGRGTYGRYWSATPNGVKNAFRLGVTANGATPDGSWNKWDAFAARCIVKNNPEP